MKLFVSGLPKDFHPKEFKEMFELYGEVRTANLVIDPATRQCKGFGFVEYRSRVEAMEVIKLLDGKSLEGTTLRVQPAEDRARA